MSLVTDPFDTMTTGVPATPPGWFSQFGPGVCYPYATPCPFALSGGVWPSAPHQYYYSNGCNLCTPTFGPANSCSIFSAYRLLTHNNTPVVPILNVWVLGNGQPGQTLNFNNEYCLDLMELWLEDDYTFSLRTGPGAGIPRLLMDNSGASTSGRRNGFQQNTWYYLELDVSAAWIPYGGNHFAQVTAQLYVDGIKVCDSANGGTYQAGSGLPLNMSGVYLTETAFGSPAISSVQYNNLGSTAYNLSAYEIDAGFAGGIPPNPGNPNVRVSQMPIEIAKLPETADVRVSQMPIEWAKLPQTANIRVSQLVIELATPYVARVPFLPEYIRARRGGH
jgi:hypothetical protein